VRTLSKIYIHCSYSPWGTRDEIARWHKERGWNDIGYHYVIHNQFATHKELQEHKRTGLIQSSTDGKIVVGRPLEVVGAHVKGDNEYSIGVCYVGVTPTSAQYHAMLYLCNRLMKQFPLISLDDILGHYEYYRNRGERIQKTCPNFDMDTFRFCLSLLPKS
jgi:hypothetical protein